MLLHGNWDAVCLVQQCLLNPEKHLAYSGCPINVRRVDWEMDGRMNTMVVQARNDRGLDSCKRNGERNRFALHPESTALAKGSNAGDKSKLSGLVSMTVD